MGKEEEKSPPPPIRGGVQNIGILECTPCDVCFLRGPSEKSDRSVRVGVEKGDCVWACPAEKNLRHALTVLYDKEMYWSFLLTIPCIASQ